MSATSGTPTDHERGLYGKYSVFHIKVEFDPTEGEVVEVWSTPGPVFVLAYETDPHARVAIQTYGAELPVAIDENRKRYRVSRIDGRDKGPYFVLAYTEDARARNALVAYAESCASDYRMLAADLRAELIRSGQ